MTIAEAVARDVLKVTRPGWWESVYLELFVEGGVLQPMAAHCTALPSGVVRGYKPLTMLPDDDRWQEWLP